MHKSLFLMLALAAAAPAGAMPMQCSGELISYSTTDPDSAIADLVTVMIREPERGRVTVELIEWDKQSDSRQFRTRGDRRVRECRVAGATITCPAPEPASADESAQPAGYVEGDLTLRHANAALSLDWELRTASARILFYGVLGCIGRPEL